MPNIKSSKKDVISSAKRRLKNKSSMSNLKTAIKKVMSATDPEVASKNLSSVISLLDEYSSKGLIPKNNAARKKSSLMAHVKKLSS